MIVCNYIVSWFVRFLSRGSVTIGVSLWDATCSWVSLEWAFPGVVVSIVVPFSVSISDAFELFVSNIVVGVGIWMWSIDTFLSGSERRWFVHANGWGSSDQSKEFHYTDINKKVKIIKIEKESICFTYCQTPIIYTLLSKNGINFFLAGEQDSIDSYLEFLESDKRFRGISLKISYTDYQPFRRMLVRLKKEIIAFDHANFTVTLKSEGVGSGGARATMTSVH